MSNHRLALLELEMGWSIWLTKDQLPFHLGRDYDNNLRNTSNCISRQHCYFDLIDDELCVVDTGSLNGTALHNRLIKNEAIPITEKTCVLLSDMMLWVTPCNEQGKPVKGTIEDFNTLDDTYSDKNGVCLVDVCDSMSIEYDKINYISQMLRATMLEEQSDQLLMLKNTGDGYLAVFESCTPILSTAKRLMDWQASNDNIFSADIRVTLDAGPTLPSHGHDRVGLPICRAARIEKTQIRDIEVPSKNLRELRSRNRCLITRNVVDQFNDSESEEYTFIGKRKLKGFAEQLHPIYQYNL